MSLSDEKYVIMACMAVLTIPIISIVYMIYISKNTIPVKIIHL